MDGQNVKLQIWDTAGEEKYKSVSNVYFRGAVGALLIYEITSKKSFEEAEGWLSKLNDTNDDLVVMLVGNKSDLKDKR